MKRLIRFILILWTLTISPALSQQHSFAPNTDNDGGQEAFDCRDDIRRFCNGPGILLFELENCLEDHTGDLKPACREHLAATDFRKYYQGQPHF